MYHTRAESHSVGQLAPFFYEGISIVNKPNEGLMQVATPAQMKRMAVMLRAKILQQTVFI